MAQAEPAGTDTARKGRSSVTGGDSSVPLPRVTWHEMRIPMVPSPLLPPQVIILLTGGPRGCCGGRKP